MEYGRYKKYYQENKTLKVDKKEKIDLKKIDLSKPLPLEKKELTKEHEQLIKNALILQQRQFNKTRNESPRIRNIIEKHNEIIKQKSFEKVIDVFKLIHFLAE